MLEEKIKQRQYDSLRQQVEEDSLIDLEHQRLQAQAKEAQRMQEEALAAKEALLKQLERQRKLQQAETELEVAKLVSSMLSWTLGRPLQFLQTLVLQTRNSLQRSAARFVHRS